MKRSFHRPLGPLLSCLTLHNVCCLLKPELRLFYLDDGSLGGALIRDVEVVKSSGGVARGGRGAIAPPAALKTGAPKYS